MLKQVYNPYSPNPRFKNRLEHTEKVMLIADIDETLTILKDFMKNNENTIISGQSSTFNKNTKILRLPDLNKQIKNLKRWKSELTDLGSANYPFEREN